ncbi:MAG: galactitol-1-phosphate 5-dehydrogenase [Christensenella sp.]|nr:galactitol-1-phosphate 5-dehydrogenase [Christensenella sp.]
MKNKNEMMKALVLHGIGDIRCEEVPRPQPKAGEVLLKIKASGICGSDVGRIFVKGTYHFPTIPGHEFAGQIVALGEGTDASLLNRAASVFPLLPCHECDMCEVGEYASCRNYNYFGSRCDGGFADYIAVPAWNLVLCDKELSYLEMAMAEPAAVSLHALSRAGINPGDVVAIFGCGAIGLMLASLAKMCGASKVILLDIDQAKLDFANSIGFEYTVNNKTRDWERVVLDITKGKGVDLALEGAGVSQTYAACLRTVKPLGKVVLMGNPAGDMNLSQHDYWEILRKQLQLFGTWNSSYTHKKNDWEIVLNAMADKKVELKPFVTQKFSLDEYQQAMKLISEKTDFYNRIIFEME